MHDFYLWTGAKKAVIDFCHENKVGYFPLGDGCSVALVAK